MKLETETMDREHARLLEDLLAGRLPDENGRFGPFGGRYVPETLIPAINRLVEGVRDILPSRISRPRSAMSCAPGWDDRPR
jgi:tryptophan synthase beta chain